MSWRMDYDQNLRSRGDPYNRLTMLCDNFKVLGRGTKCICLFSEHANVKGNEPANDLGKLITK